MNHEIEKLILKNDASMVGFAKIDGLYNSVDLDGPKSEDSVTEPINIPHYPIGISIVLAYSKEIIRNISDAPTMDYYNRYFKLNEKLDELAVLCADYIKKQGYNAYPQTVSNTRKKAREIAAKTLNKQITLCGKCIEVCPYTRRYTIAT